MTTQITHPAEIKPEGPHLLPNLITVPRFAKLRGVSVSAVRFHIFSSKKITPTYVGEARDLYLDLDQYKNFVFYRASNQ